VLLSVLLAGLLLTGCTSSPAPSGSPSASAPSASAPSAGASSPGDDATPAGALTLDITIKNGQVSPNGAKIDVTRGQTVVLNVTSDADDEVHAHTSGDGYELEVTAGVPATGQFVAADTGSFEVESHHLEKVIAILVVR
jgi:hypothetical protein